MASDRNTESKNFIPHSPQLTATTFAELNLMEPLLKALEKEGYEHPTPIQQQAIGHILAQRDLLACAQTGTGKTAAFALPILQLLATHKLEKALSTRMPIRVLVLTPTRELAAQIGESFDRYGSSLQVSNTVIFGGVGQGAQVSALRKGVDILVATPGRLLDLIDQRFIDLSKLEIFVLDEADRMLDMGFIHDVKRVIKLLPKKRHSLFFSATMPTDIQSLARDILTQPVKVEVTPVATTAEKIKQSVYFVEKIDKRRLLEKLVEDFDIRRALVFSRTKHGADKIARFLSQGGVEAEAIHGNKSQNNRIRALNNFKEGKTRVLVATDIAARGIDIDGVTHVINFELPNVPESYVHRIGRTARAGAEGVAISFCDREERPFLVDIERLIRMKVPVVEHGLSAAPPMRETDRRPEPRSDSRGAQRPHTRSQVAQSQRPTSQNRNDARRGSSRPAQGQGPARADARPSHSEQRPSRPGQRAGRPDERSSRPESRFSRPDQRPAASGARSEQRSGPSGRTSNAQSQRSSRPNRDEPRSSRGPQRAETKPEAQREATAGKSKQPWWKKILPSK